MHLASPVSLFCSLWLALPSELAGLHAASADHCLNLIVDVLNKVSWIIAVWPQLFLYLHFATVWPLSTLHAASADSYIHWVMMIVQCSYHP